LTRLTAQTLTGFLDDSAERDADGYGRSIVLLGFAAASAKAFDSLRDHIARFVRGSRDGPDLVIVQTGDSAEYVFTPHEPSPEAKRLLSTWGLVPSGTQRVPYKRLGVAKLEAIFDIR
jgi:hypothetical protein